MITVNRLWALELSFEQDDSALLSQLAVNDQGIEGWIAKMLLAAKARNNTEVIALAASIMKSADGPLTFAFCMQFALAASEIMYNMEVREKLLKQWQQLPSGPHETYVVYLRLFSQAVTCYFESKFSEAGNLFDRCLNMASEMNYPRGQMRSLFHLGLVNKERGFLDRAQGFFNQAKAIAVGLRAERFLLRFEHGLSSAKCVQLESQLMRNIDRGEWQSARQTYLALERERRKDRQTRGANSYYIYLAVLCFAFGKGRSYLRVLRGTGDPAIKQRLLDLKKKLFDLTLEERAELDFLRIGLGMNVVIQRSGDIEIAGIPLATLENEDVRKFLLLLSKSESLSATKESICQALWNYSYDPTVHDNRIYKLIYKCRRITNAPNLIVNDYGTYRLNTKYVNLQDRLSG